MILTDSQGKPFSKPEAPPEGADVETKIAYIRAVHAWRDQVTACANHAFDEAFRP